MADRRLTAEEAALWRRVMANVRPSRPASVLAKPVDTAQQAPAIADKSLVKNHKGPGAAMPTPVARAKPVAPGVTLDGSWDRKLATGGIVPDSTIDLHGHTLDTAYAVLDAGLARSVARGDRVLLLITGKPPRAESERPHARGRIRAAVNDWLAASRHAGSIAAVRGAHPRHGGAGALYIVLRRHRHERIS